MKNAHLPAYRMMGYQVESIYDPKRDLAEQLAQDFEISKTLTDLESLPEGRIFDIATPASAIAAILQKIPVGSFVLMQKPMGETLSQAEEIVRICEERNLKAAVNFQLRWAPYTLALKELIAKGELGEIVDVEFKINVHTPWALWSFLELAPRMEMVYHSIHYIDLVRDLLGEPVAIWARSIKHPDSAKLESSRSLIYFEYGEMLRATISTYHAHKAGSKYEESYLKVEGTRGVAKLQMGLNLDYPKGGSDYLHVWTENDDRWRDVPFEGSWFPHAYRGPMSAMMNWVRTGEPPSTEVHQSLKTMQLVEDAYYASDLFGRN
jgi:predicted dehydrogenase